MNFSLFNTPFITLRTTLLHAGLLAGLLAGGTAHAAANQWEILPPTPKNSALFKTADVNGIKLAYSISGEGYPLVILHGGPANSDYLANQAALLSKHFKVISVDTRGHGRSSQGEQPLGYDLFADDVAVLMTQLGVAKANFLGWSDGGITALDLAMRYPLKVDRVVAFGANVDTAGTFTGADKKPAFAQMLKRAPQEYATLSPTPKGFEQLNAQLTLMYSTQPDWTEAQLKTIKAPVLVVDGEHDEAIRPEHTRYIANTLPNASLAFIPGTSHFAFLQNPQAFNTLVTNFLQSDPATSIGHALVK
ncbi:alpha/beta fold hydrolase [Pseudomonas sp. SDO5271_S396]